MNAFDAAWDLLKEGGEGFRYHGLPEGVAGVTEQVPVGELTGGKVLPIGHNRHDFLPSRNTGSGVAGVYYHGSPFSKWRNESERLRSFAADIPEDVVYVPPGKNPLFVQGDDFFDWSRLLLRRVLTAGRGGDLEDLIRNYRHPPSWSAWDDDPRIKTWPTSLPLPSYATGGISPLPSHATGEGNWMEDPEVLSMLYDRMIENRGLPPSNIILSDMGFDRLIPTEDAGNLGDREASRGSVILPPLGYDESWMPSFETITPRHLEMMADEEDFLFNRRGPLRYGPTGQLGFFPE